MMNETKIITEIDEAEVEVKKIREKLALLKDEEITLFDVNVVMATIAKGIADMLKEHPNEEVNGYALILSYMESVYASLIATIEHRRKNSNA